MDGLIQHACSYENFSLPEFAESVQRFEEKVNASANSEHEYLNLIKSKIQSIQKAVKDKSQFINPSASGTNANKDWQEDIHQQFQFMKNKYSTQILGLYQKLCRKLEDGPFRQTLNSKELYKYRHNKSIMEIIFSLFERSKSQMTPNMKIQVAQTYHYIQKLLRVNNMLFSRWSPNLQYKQPLFGTSSSTFPQTNNMFSQDRRSEIQIGTSQHGPTTRFNNSRLSTTETLSASFNSTSMISTTEALSASFKTPRFAATGAFSPNINNPRISATKTFSPIFNNPEFATTKALSASFNFNAPQISATEAFSPNFNPRISAIGAFSPNFNTLGISATENFSASFSAPRVATTKALSAGFNSPMISATEAFSASFSTPWFATTEALSSGFNSSGISASEAFSSNFKTPDISPTKALSASFNTPMLATNGAFCANSNSPGISATEDFSAGFNTLRFATTEALSASFNTPEISKVDDLSAIFKTPMFAATGVSCNSPRISAGGDFSANLNSPGISAFEDFSTTLNIPGPSTTEAFNSSFNTSTIPSIDTFSASLNSQTILPSTKENNNHNQVSQNATLHNQEQTVPTDRFIKEMTYVSPEVVNATVTKIGEVVRPNDEILDEPELATFPEDACSLPMKRKYSQTVENQSLLAEINEINTHLVDCEVGVAFDRSEGLIVKILFNAVTVNEDFVSKFTLDKKSLIKPLLLLIPSSYPSSSIVILDELPSKISEDLENLYERAKGKLRMNLENMKQPLLIKHIARAWEQCAKEAILDYEHANGDGIFTSMYDDWDLGDLSFIQS